MGLVTIDIDSGERDLTLYPSPNDYTIRTNKTLFGVNRVRLLTARLVNCQNLINTGNRQFQIDGTTITLPVGTYTNGTALASNLQTALGATNVSTVAFNPFTNKLTFSNVGTGNNFTFKFFTGSNGATTSSLVGTPAQVMGFSGIDVTSSGGHLVSNIIDLTGATSIIVRLTCSGEDLMQPVYVDGGSFSFNNALYENPSTLQIAPTYIGRIPLGPPGSCVPYTQMDYLIDFPVKDVNIKDIRVRLYWNNGTKLIPYDFGMTNHMLKFEFTCETDRLMKVYKVSPVDELPEPINELPPTPSKTLYIIAFVVLFLGLMILIG